MKHLIAAWRILVGVWVPKAGDISLSSLRNILPATSAPLGATPSSIPNATNTTPSSGAQSTTLTDSNGSIAPPHQTPKRIPTRRLVRHVLRTRVEAAKSLDQYLSTLESSSSLVPARPWLVEPDYEPPAVNGDGNELDRFPMVERDSREVVRFLRQRGAKIRFPTSGDAEWADAGSGDERDGDVEDDGRKDIKFE